MFLPYYLTLRSFRALWFQWNWWVAWAVFVGLFIARISYGRTLREVTIYTLVFPLLYLVLWFSVWGGAGLRQARQALELEQLGLTHYNDTDHFVSAENENCFDVPQESVVVGNDTIFENHMTGVTPVCKFYSTNEASFNVLYSFSFPDEWDVGYGPYLSIIFMLSLGAYFATSSDSGSLVVDFLAANGRHDTHWIQRLFWALTEASVATALLSAGGSNSLAALQAASIISGLPYTFILLYLLQSIYEMCEQAMDEDQIQFKVPERRFIMPVYGGVFNIFEYVASLGSVHTTRVVLGLDLPSSFQTTEFFSSLVLPFLSLQDILFTMYPKPQQRNTNVLFLVSYALLFFFWVTCVIVSITLKPSLIYWGIAAYISCTCLLANLKRTVRNRRRLHGNVLGDLMSSLLLYPQVITQIRIELIEYGADQVELVRRKKKKKKAPVATSSRSKSGFSECDESMALSAVSSNSKKRRQTSTTSSASRKAGDDTSKVRASSTMAGVGRGSVATAPRDMEQAPPVENDPEDQELRANSNHNPNPRGSSRSPTFTAGSNHSLTSRRTADDVRDGLRARLEERKQKHHHGS